jgi:hypothetical protein
MLSMRSPFFRRTGWPYLTISKIILIQSKKTWAAKIHKRRKTG